VAGLASENGVVCLVPDLTSAAGSSEPSWEDIVDAVARSALAVDGPFTVVGHSGAGAFLPLIGDALGDRLDCLVFVDAVVPPTEGTHVTSPGLRKLLDDRVEDGVLLNWFDWWPRGTIVEMVGDEALVVMMRGEAPRLRRALYDQAVPMPPDWASGRCAYVRLSRAYDADAAEATERGWPVSEIDSNHLGMVSEPPLVFDAIASVVRALP